MQTKIFTICLLAIFSPTLGSLIMGEYPMPGAVSSSSSANTTINPTFTKSISDFSVALYEAVTAQKDGNLILSPLSAQTALSLLYCGAGPETATTMADALDFQDDSPTVITNQFQRLLTPLQTNPTLNIANALYVMDGYKIQPSFLSKARNSFFATVANIDFSKNVAAANTINTWVANKTHDKIKNLISSGDLDASTRTVLLNAIYFHGDWIHPFSARSTYKQTFNLSCESSIQIPMMHLTAEFNYNLNSDLNAQVIELGYKNTDVSMVIILPTDVDGLQGLQEALNTYDLNQLYSELRFQRVVLTLPKFKIESTLNLNDPLIALGLGDLFSGFADFSKMITDQNGHATQMEVSKVIQKAYIEVDETGATAAAATGIMMYRMAIRQFREPTRFNANHPFVFFLKTQVSTLFVGTYSGAS